MHCNLQILSLQGSPNDQTSIICNVGHVVSPLCTVTYRYSPYMAVQMIKHLSYVMYSDVTLVGLGGLRAVQVTKRDVTLSECSSGYLHKIHQGMGFPAH